MAKLNIIYFSGTGNTEQMATYIEEGAKSAGVEVEMISVDSADENSVEADFLAFGSPATGSEEVAPEIADFVESVKDKLKGKKIGVFGSYDWGEGDWLSMWIQDLDKEDISVVGEGCMVNLSPDDDEKVEACKEYGKAIVS
ncbi:nitric oxide synthase [Leptotrichia sp. OH3620_COT-345]|uniref:flavodoxin domain-containing protein n=1 Tax=Leptotrichia sp. OH3620_COT-345 TaxID=2491048 RepID=UPI000F652A3D|nr:flavodoxin domain-containing protein [Leptotrichia sp. OH3620_COT-345]RRD39172.1 nitric oxide synthase [Leptotrichia sp. OH3620_COT-345]